MKKSVLVTGGAGFIGRETIRKLVSSGYDVFCFDLAEQIQRHKDTLNEITLLGKLTLISGSILDKNSLCSAINGVDIVIHLAAMLGVKKTEDNKLGCIEVNISGTENVLAASVMHGVKKFVFASSSEVYGEPDTNPINESQTTKGKTVYAVSKIAGEELTKGYNQRYPNLDFTIIRFFNTYGEGQVAQFVLAKWVMNALQGINPLVYGDGNQVRSYGHVIDVTAGVQKILENNISNGKTYNLGNSTQVRTLKELAKQVIDIVAPDKGLTVEVLGDFNGADREPEREIHVRYCDTSFANRELNYKPIITVEEGIKRIAAQVKIHSDWPKA
jgi:UDP-glucose 4-epimerase